MPTLLSFMLHIDIAVAEDVAAAATVTANFFCYYHH